MASQEQKILPHGDLEELAPGLWSVTGSLPIPMKRNMTVVRLADGTLLLHSVIALDAAGLAKLDSLGKPSLIIVPSGGHRMDAPFYKRRYPAARVVCPAGARAKIEKVVAVDATCEEALPPAGVVPHPLPGYRTHEMAYEVPIGGGGGRALLFCDAVTNKAYTPTLGGRILANTTGGVKGRLGVPRIVRLMMVKDKAAARDALARLADVPDLALVTLAHGSPVKERVPEALREAAGYF